ncbi:MAG: cryptochrome/photolyase family protein [Bdellovibrionia bacterium]
MAKVTLFWMRRDLRLEDNAGLYHALKQGAAVLPVFIFDTEILKHLGTEDLRVQFIHQRLIDLKSQLQQLGSDLVVRLGQPLQVWQELLQDFAVESVYFNHDYEPYARRRDQEIIDLLRQRGVAVYSFKDQTLFEKDEVLSDQKKPYTVYTPYKKKVLAKLAQSDFFLKSYPSENYFSKFAKIKDSIPMLELEQIGFKSQEFTYPQLDLNVEMLKKYSERRDFPYLQQATSHLGLHLRFGTVSVRELAREGQRYSDTWLSELIWRDFFMQILWHFPEVEKRSFRPIYDQIAWRNAPEDLSRWQSGQTGYPIVDAGMRELNATGYMHNRVRMIVASFLTKHLLIHWREGERYFASKLLDYDLSANNGNWQWAAGSGCDAAPYFRIFNPEAQTEKFDPDYIYIKKWVPEYGTPKYPRPMVDHVFARGRCLQEFSKVLKK